MLGIGAADEATGFHHTRWRRRYGMAARGARAAAGNARDRVSQPWKL